MVNVTIFYECDDCGNQFFRNCRKCGKTKLCRKCYNILDGLCFDCRESELNGDED